MMIAWTPIFRWNVRVEEIDELVGLTGLFVHVNFFYAMGEILIFGG